MRAGHTHKTAVERALLNVRARVHMAMNELEGEENLGEAGARALAELQEAEKALRGVELKVSVARSRSLFSTDDGAVSAQTSADMRNWLLSTFTDQDIEAAVGNAVLKEEPTARSPSASSGHRVSIVQDFFGEIRSGVLDEAVNRILGKCGALEFDALALEEHPEAKCYISTILGSHLMRKCPRLSRHTFQEQGWIASSGDAFMQAYVAFLMKIDGLYANSGAIYHGAAHAADVTATTHWLLQSEFMRDRISALDHFMAIVAAAVHDVAHPGNNNLFHTKTMSPLAIRYNDRSVLENMHVALAFETMKSDEDCDWFSMLAKDAHVQAEDGDASGHTANLQHYMRNGMISMVLATDMAKHTGHVQELTSLAQELTEDMNMMQSESYSGSANAQQKALQRKLFVLETALHAADMSNPAKPRHMVMEWTRRVLAEFWAQGDEERNLGLEVSPLCDRSSGSATVPKGQLGFINFVVSPLFTPLALLIPEAKQATAGLAATSDFWREQDALGLSYEQLFGDDGVAQKVKAEAKAAEEARRREEAASDSEPGP